MSFTTPNIRTAVSNGPLFGPSNEITWRNSINFRNVECDRPVLNVTTCSGPIFGVSDHRLHLNVEEDSDAAAYLAELNDSDEADVPSSNDSGNEVNGEECSDNAEATDGDEADVDLGSHDNYDSDVSEEDDNEADVDASDNENDSEVDDEDYSDNSEVNDSDDADVASGSSDNNDYGSDVSDEDDTDPDIDAGSDEQSTAEDEISSLNFGAPSKSNTTSNVEIESNAKAKSTQQPAVPYGRNSSTENDTNSAKGNRAQRNDGMEPVAGPSSAADFPPPTTTEADSNLHLSLTFLHDILKSGLNSESYSKLKSEYAVSCESLLNGPVMNKEIKKVLSQEVKNTDETIKEIQDKIGIGISALNTAINLLIVEKRLPHALRAILNACRIFADLHYEETKKRQAVTRGMFDDSILGSALLNSIRDETLFGTDLTERVHVKDIKRKKWRSKSEKRVVSSSQSRSTCTYAGQNTISVKQNDAANQIPTTCNAGSTKPNSGPSNRDLEPTVSNLEPSNSNHEITTSDLESPTSHQELVTSNSKPIITSLERAISTLEDTVSRFVKNSLTNQLPSTTDNEIICDKMTISGLRTAFQGMEKVISSYKKGIPVNNTTLSLTDYPTTSSQPASASAENGQITTEQGLRPDSRSTSLKEAVNQQVASSNPKATTSTEAANAATTSHPKATTSREGPNSATTANPKATTSREGCNSATTSNPKATTSREGANFATTSNSIAITSTGDVNSNTTSNPKATTSKENAISATTLNPKATTSTKSANSATTSNLKTMTSKEAASSTSSSNPKTTISREGATFATSSNLKGITSKESATSATASNPKATISREVTESLNRKASDPIAVIFNRRSMESTARAAALSVLEGAWATIKKVLENLQLNREISSESKDAENFNRRQTVYSKNLLVTELEHIVKNLNAYIMQHKEQHKNRNERIFSFETMFISDEKITSEQSKSNTTDETRVIKLLKIAVTIIQTAKLALTLNPLGTQFLASNADAFVTPIELIHSCIDDLEEDTISTNDEVATSNQDVPSDSLKNAASILRHIISDVDSTSTKLATTTEMCEHWDIQTTIEELKDAILRFKTAVPILELFNNVITDEGYPWNRPISTFVKKYTDINLYIFNIETCILILTNTLKQEPGELLTKANHENIIAILGDTLQKMEKNVTTLKSSVKDQSIKNSNNLTVGNTNQNDSDLKDKQVNISSEQNTVTNAGVVVSNIKATPLSNENVTNQKTAKINNQKEVSKKIATASSKQPISTDLNKGLTQDPTGSSQVPSKDSELRDNLREHGELESMINSLNDVITSVKTDLGANLKQFDENFQSRLNNIKTQLENQISNIDPNNTQVMIDEANTNRIEIQGIRNVKRVNDTQAGRRYDVHHETKTQPEGSRDEHTVTAARPGGSKDVNSITGVRPRESEVVHTVTEARPGGSKDVYSEAKVRPGGSKVVHNVSETRPGGSKDVHSETEIRPGRSKGVYKVPEPQPGESKDVPRVTKVRRGGNKDVLSVSEIIPGGSKGVLTVTEGQLGGSKDVPNVTEARPGGSKDVHSEAEIPPGGSKGAHGEAEIKSVHKVTESRPGGDHESNEATSVKDVNSTPETQTRESEEYRSVKDIIKSMNDRAKMSNTDKNTSAKKN